MWEGLTKKWGKKNIKIKNSSPSANKSTRGRGPSLSARDGALGEESPSPSASMALGEALFIFFCERLRPMLPSNAPFLLRVPVFPECCTRGRWPSPSAWFPRVSCPFRHSGKPLFPECRLPRVLHSGKRGFPECPIFGTRGSIWHSGNSASPVVI
jgi:hypothetical protein